MKRFRTACALLACAAALLPATPALADLRTHGTITSLAMDGPRVAVGVEHTLTRCDRALVWNAVAGGVVTVSAGRGSAGHPSVTCPADRANGGIGQVALAGTRVAWVVSFGGNTEFTDYLVVASATSPGHERLLERPTYDPESEAGQALSGVVGHGALLVAARNDLDGSSSDPVNGRLTRLDGLGHATRIVSSAQSLRPLATDGARAVVLRGDGSVLLVSSGGRLLQTVAPGAAVRGAALAGDKLAQQVAGNRVLLYSTGTGRLTRTLQLAAGTAAGIDLAYGRLVYRTYLAVHVVRLAGGRDGIVATTPRGALAAQIDEHGGLVYAYNLFETGFVKHLTLAQIDARLRAAG